MTTFTPEKETTSVLRPREGKRDEHEDQNEQTAGQYLDPAQEGRRLGERLHKTLEKIFSGNK